MRRDQIEAYRDQFEFLADCFELVRKRGDAFNIRSEALETERMVRYGQRAGFESERSHLLEIYRDIEAEVQRLEERVLHRKNASDAAGTRFPIDRFMERHGLAPEELQILLVLLYNESTGQSHARFDSGNEILNLLFPNPVSALKASRFLDSGSTLQREGLIRATGDESAANFLRASYEVTEATLQAVLGVRDRERFRADAPAYRASVTTAPDSPLRTFTPRVTLDRVALPPALRERLAEVLWQIEEGEEIFREWGLDAVVEKGRGTVLLFSGPPGTGKTMTAEALAERLGRSLSVVDYSQVESKWIGETEKNIVAVFREAGASGSVLLIDEADAILGARLDGGHYNDRAYNRQVSLLLTELEAFDGVCILTTNREVTLDEALARRISANLHFPLPGPQERLRIWRMLLTERTPRAEDVDLAALSREFPIPGGSIRNAVLAAVRRAARRDGRGARLTQEDLRTAAARERNSFERETRPIGFSEPPERSYS